MTDIRSATEEEVRAAVAQLGEPPYRAGQIVTWLQQKGAESFDEMTNLPKALREKMKGAFELRCAKKIQRWDSSLDDTSKYLFELNDGETIESVLMHYHHGYSVCISSQVGCKMGCTFCATGMGGFQRNLTPSEMLAQIQSIERDKNVRVSNIVLMGMGEPLDNYDAVLRFLRLVSAESGLNIGMRHISLSTCGVVDRIYDLMREKLQLTLSVSLHAPNDEIRKRTMPVARRWSMHELLTACREYEQTTGRRISFEYAMISGVNDSDACARELAEKLCGTLCHVNLIPVNEVKENQYKRSSRERLERFSDILSRSGIAVTVRRTLGSDINASCGQLRRKRLEQTDSPGLHLNSF
jgi:23S rRNA (adenine2503-C2)-methyltransferase